MTGASLGAPLLTAKVDTTSSGALIAGVTGQVIQVYAIALTMASGTMTFKNGTTALTGAMTFTQLVLPMHQSLHPLYTCSSGSDFTGTLSGSQQTSGTIWYTQA